MYYKPIDKESRKAMISFLREHCRYYTMNSWNRSSSYANNIKLHNIEKPGAIDDDTWWSMLEIAQWQTKLSDLREDFGSRYNWQWQVGINGRSGGYLVLYRGGIKPSGYQSYCSQCGQKNYQLVPEGQTGICGRCNAKARSNFSQTPMQIFTWPGKDVDMDEDFADWPLTELRQRVELIQDLDRLCDTIIEEYIFLCKNYRITEEEIMLPKMIKVLEPNRPTEAI